MLHTPLSTTKYIPIPFFVSLSLVLKTSFKCVSISSRLDCTLFPKWMNPVNTPCDLTSASLSRVSSLRLKEEVQAWPKPCSALFCSTMFYQLSLPCSPWPLDRKSTEIVDKTSEGRMDAIALVAVNTVSRIEEPFSIQRWRLWELHEVLLADHESQLFPVNLLVELLDGQLLQTKRSFMFFTRHDTERPAPYVPPRWLCLLCRRLLKTELWLSSLLLLLLRQY